MDIKLQTLSPAAIVKVKDSHVLIGLMMAHFNVREITINRWLNANDHKLANPAIVKMIAKHTGMSESEILSPEQDETPTP